jgi:ATP-dependent exoDNAse (exonuclease V) beta subunit
MAIDSGAYNVQQKKEKGLSLEEAALQVLRDYETIPLVPPYHFVPQTVNASSLHFKSSVYKIPGTDAADSDAIDELFEQCGIEAQEFGTIVHGFIEAIFNSVEPKLPLHIAASLGIQNQKVLASAAQNLAEGFFKSALGRKALSAAFRKTEYPILTMVEGRLVSGTIDLLFDDGPSIYIIDFKTDRDEDITRHIGQLAIYKRAVEDIFGKPVECRLFYLRSSHEVNLNEEIAKTSPEKLIAELIAAWEQ